MTPMRIALTLAMVLLAAACTARVATAQGFRWVVAGQHYNFNQPSYQQEK